MKRARELTRLDAAGLDALAARLRPLTAQVFPDLPAESLPRILCPDTARSARMHLMTCAGAPTGYHVFSLHPWRSALVFRVFSCLGPAAKGQGSLQRLGFRELLRARLRHPTRELHFFTCYVNPVPYHVMVRSFPEAWPHPTRAMPDAVAARLFALGDHFGFERCPGREPWVRRTAGSMAPDVEEQARVASSTSDAIQQFVAWCPDYLEGHGVITTAPLTWRHMARALR